MYNFPYKLLALDVIKELSKSDDEEIICKFVKELCRLSKLKQYEKYKIPKIAGEKINDSRRKCKECMPN